MKKYIMTSTNDYRPNTDNHEVLLVKRDLNGVEWAYGNFSTIDDDMLDCTYEEIAEVSSVGF